MKAELKLDVKRKRGSNLHKEAFLFPSYKYWYFQNRALKCRAEIPRPGLIQVLGAWKAQTNKGRVKHLYLSC